MALLPIDMTITVQRTPELNRTHTGESVRPEVAQQQFADKMNHDVQMQDQQVMQTNKAEEGKVDADGRGNAGGQGANRGKKEKNNKKTKQAVPVGSNSFFDVSI